MSLAQIDCRKISDWGSFHDEFQRVFGFPDFYGRNMDAWIDCMSSIDSPEDGMSEIHCRKGGFLTIELAYVDELEMAELLTAVVDCTAFVNYRAIHSGESPLLALSYHRNAI